MNLNFFLLNDLHKKNSQPKWLRAFWAEQFSDELLFSINNLKDRFKNSYMLCKYGNVKMILLHGSHRGI